jgi:hypothetical protein
MLILARSFVVHEGPEEPDLETATPRRAPGVLQQPLVGDSLGSAHVGERLLQHLVSSRCHARDRA